jgi:hypothetical protein
MGSTGSTGAPGAPGFGLTGATGSTGLSGLGATGPTGAAASYTVSGFFSGTPNNGQTVLAHVLAVAGLLPPGLGPNGAGAPSLAASVTYTQIGGTLDIQRRASGAPEDGWESVGSIEIPPGGGPSSGSTEGDGPVAFGAGDAVRAVWRGGAEPAVSGMMVSLSFNG